MGGIFLSEGFTLLKVASQKIKPLLQISFEVNLRIIHSKYLLCNAIVAGFVYSLKLLERIPYRLVS